MLVLSVVTADAAAPSFDCEKAQTGVEKTICGRADLAKADAEMTAAYRDLARKLTPSAAALLAKDQKDFLMARDYAFGFYDKDGAGMLGDWITSRTKFLQEVRVAEPGRLVGHWGNVTGELTIKPVADARLDLSIDTSEPFMGRWVCSVTGAGTIVDGALRVREDDGSVLTVRRDGQALTVAVTPPPNAHDWTTSDCGRNGSVDGTYVPIAADSQQGADQQGERSSKAVARLSSMASRSSLSCNNEGVCKADGFDIGFGDCSSDVSYGGIAATDGVTLLDQLAGRDAKPVARLANRQLVCIEATAKKGQQEFYYVRAVPVASVAGCKGKALCRSYGDRPVQWLRPRSGEPCRPDAATKAYVGDCAAGWVDQSSLEEFSMGL